MQPGGELAALFARRAKVADEEDGHENANANNDAKKVVSASPSIAAAPAPAPHARQPPATTAGRKSLPPRASPPSTSTSAPARPPQAQASAPPPLVSPPPAAEPDKVATPSQNEELKAKFESRNSEAGIPTPSFLLNARLGLKKQSSESIISEPDFVDTGSKVNVKAMASAVVASSSHNGGFVKSNSFSSEGKLNMNNNDKGKGSGVGGVSASPHGHGYVKSNSLGGGRINKNYSHSSSESETNKKYEKGVTASPGSGYAKSNSFQKAQGGDKKIMTGSGSEAHKTPEKVAPVTASPGAGGGYAKVNSFRKSSGSSSKFRDLNAHLASPGRDADAKAKPESDKSLPAATPTSSTNGYAKSNSFSRSKSIHKSVSTSSSSSDVGKSSSFASGGGGGSRNNINTKASSTCSADNFPVDEAVAASTVVANVKRKNRRSRSGSVGDATSNNNATTATGTVNVNSSKTDTSRGALSARRSRMVAARGVTLTSASSVLSNESKTSTTNGDTTTVLGAAAAKSKSKKSSPAGVRREKLLARVRASSNNNFITASAAGAGAAGKNKSSSSNGSNNNNNPKPTGSKAATGMTVETDSATSFDASKTSIISPTRDEFEVLFADTGSNFAIAANGIDANASIDSIGNEMLEQYNALNNSTSTAGSAGTQLASNVRNKGGANKNKVGGVVSMNKNITPTKPRLGVNSQQSRLHNASTPKIRGNGQYKRESYDHVGEMEMIGENNNIKSVPSSGSGTSRSQQQSSQQHDKMSSFQEQQQIKQSPSSEDYHETQQLSTPSRRNSQYHQDMNQPYPLRNSPSQMSQMSGLTTPSCFPQDFHVPSHTSMGHLQQPMLVGGPIHENSSTGTGSSPRVEGSSAKERGGSQQIVASSSAFSSGMESENRRIREQLASCEKKLEEKDAIISQLMKRIGDLENIHNGSRQQQHHVGTTQSFASHQSSHQNNQAPTPISFSPSLHSAGGRSQNNIDSHAMSSLWDQSQPHSHQNAFTHSSSGSAFVQQHSNSHDTESAFLSLPSSSMPGSPRSRSSLNGQPSRGRSGSSSNLGGARSGSTKASPNTTTTSSTASVTTANSSKSNRSKSVSVDGTRRSPHRKSKKKNDDRKFVC